MLFRRSLRIADIRIEIRMPYNLKFPPDFHNLVQVLAWTAVPVSCTNGDVSTPIRPAELSRLSYPAIRWLAIAWYSYVRVLVFTNTSTVRTGNSAAVLL